MVRAFYFQSRLDGWSFKACVVSLDIKLHSTLSEFFSRGNKCHLMAKSFLREQTEPMIFGIWPVGYSNMNLDHLESSGIPKRTPFLKLFNVRTSLFCCFEKRLTLNLEEKADCLKLFIRTNYVPAIKFG